MKKKNPVRFKHKRIMANTWTYLSLRQNRDRKKERKKKERKKEEERRKKKERKKEIYSILSLVI